MAQILRIDSLPAPALDAEEMFRTQHLPAIRTLLEQGHNLTLVLPPATYDHDDWRQAITRDLARAYAPARVNMVAGKNASAISASVHYLAKAPGITGQYLPVTGAGRFDGASE